jgi:hypothetical protein
MRTAQKIAVTVAGAALVFGTTTATAQAEPGTVHGCKLGYFCIYPRDAGWNGDVPSNTYYRYGPYQLKDQIGFHYLFNNQTGPATVLICTDWNGRTCPQYMPPGPFEAAMDLGPINSIRLNPS